MATFYYDRFSSANIYSQWTKHLQSEEYIKDIGGIISKNRQELQTTINNASVEQRKAIQQVCGNLDDGFGLISSHLSDIKYELGEIRGEINAMASMLDWKLSMLIEEQRLTNQLLGHIAQLLRIPDSQKQRVYHIEQGLKYLKNAIMEGINSTFYDDAIESFKEAEKIERKDFFTLNRIGQIYLYSSKHMDIPLAEEYFLKSAREALAEVNVGGSITKNYLVDGLNKNSVTSQATPRVGEVYEGIITKIMDFGAFVEFLPGKEGLLHISQIDSKRVQKVTDYFNEGDKVNVKLVNIENGKFSLSRKELTGAYIEEFKPIRKKNINPPVDSIKLYTAEAYLYASRACYLQQKLSEAVNLSGKAYNLVPEFVEGGFEQAKFLAANNQIEESVKVIETVIKKDRYYSVKALSDQDLSSKPLVLKLLANLQQEAISKAITEHNECKSIMSIKSKAKQVIDKIEENISKNSFLSCMYALDLLNADYRIPYSNYFVGGYNGEEINKRIVNEPIKILELIKKENYSANELESLKSKIKNKMGITRTFAGLGIGAGIGIVIGFFKGCTLKDFSMDGVVWLNTIIICAIIGAIIGAFVGFVKEIKINE